MGRRLALAVLAAVILAAGSCSASRELQQTPAAATPAAAPESAAASPAAAASIVSHIQVNAPGTSNLLNAPALAPASGPLPAGVVNLAENPAAVSDIQLNAPGTSNLLNAPALAPASAPLPADVVSLALKQNADQAAQDQLAASPAAAASTVSHIQLNAPGNSNLLNAPALAPASGSLPVGVVSLAAKQNANSANQATQVQDQLAKAEATPETFIPASPGKGEYSTIAGIDNSGNSLPAGYTDKPLSASELAQVEASKSRSKVQQTTSNAATVASPASDAGQQVAVHPTSMSKQTVDQVNKVAPTYQVSKSLSVKPQLATANGLASKQGNSGKQQRIGQATSGGKQSVSSTASTASSTTPITVGGRTVQVFIPSIGNPEEATGDYLSFINGVRIATPFFGTGYNFCIDRYFGSFPKVGIVIPNAAAWLLPEFQDFANVLEHTLDLPSILPHGARVDPTADGFLIWLPTFQPSQVPEFGIRYGIQIGQAFGYDFGFGIVKQICFVSFAIV